MIEIEFYETEDGKCPLQEYLDSLEPKILAKTLRTIEWLYKKDAENTEVGNRYS